MSAKLTSTADSIDSGALSRNQERLLYLLSLYSDTFLSIPHISVLVFEGTQEPEVEGDSDSEDVSMSRRSEDVSIQVSDKYTFTYTFFQSFADVTAGTQIQIYASMVLKNDLRSFKKQELVSEEKQERETGIEHCYQITDKGRDLILSSVSEKSKITVHNIVYAPGTANLLSVIVKNRSFYITTSAAATAGSDGAEGALSSDYEKKSGITRPQERADEEADDPLSEDEEEAAELLKQEMRRQSFKLSSLQKSLSEKGLGGDGGASSEEPTSKACTIQ